VKTKLVRGGGLVAILILAIFLFVTGKEHAIFIINKGEAYTPKNVYYVLDNEKKEVKIKKKKKKREYVKGTTHEIKVRFEDENGTQVEASRDFKVKLGEKITINVALIEDSSKWIIREKEEK